MGKITLHNYEAFLLDYLEGNLGEAEQAALKAFAMTHPELEIDLDNNDLPVFNAERLELDFKDRLKKTEADLAGELLLNYLECTLPEAKRQEVEARLLTDSAFAQALALLKKTILIPDHSKQFTNKAGLLKTEDELALNNPVIAYYENQLSATEKVQFELELKASAALQNELALVAKTRLQADPALLYPDRSGLKKEGRVVTLFSTRSVAALAAAVLMLLVLSFVFNYYTKPAAVNPSGLAKKGLPKTNPGAKPSSPSLPEDIKQAVPAKDIQPQNHLAATAQPKPPVNHTVQPGNPVTQQAQPPVAVAENSNKQSNGTVETSRNEALPASNKSASSVDQIAANQPIQHSNAAAFVADVQTNPALVLQEGYDDDIDNSSPEHKSGFWNKAMALAKRANKLGIKSLNVREKAGRNFSLSFNAFSVEKH